MLKLEVEIIRFDAADVIATSGENCAHVTARHLYVSSAESWDTASVTIYAEGTGAVEKSKYGKEIGESTWNLINGHSNSWYYQEDNQWHYCGSGDTGAFEYHMVDKQ